MSYTKDTSITFPAKYSWHAAQGGNSVGPGDYTGVVSQLVRCIRTRTGQNLPKWKSVIAAGGNATTPLTGALEEFYSTPVDVKYDLLYPPDGSWAVREFRGDVAFGLNGCLLFGVSPQSPMPDYMLDVERADNRARASFYKKLRATQVQFSGPIFLGELRETLRMIRHPAQAIRDSADRYYRSLSKWRGANRPPSKSREKFKWRQELQRVAGGLWLENSFGWQPLLHDIEDAVRAYEKLTVPVSNAVVISVGATDKADFTNTYVGQGAGSNPAYHNRDGVVFRHNVIRCVQSCTIRYKGSVSVSTEADQWRNRSLFGFRADEFLPTAWELLPWSFLIDYFTNVGDLLTSVVTRTSDINYVNRTQRTLLTLNGNWTADAERTRTSIGSSWVISGSGGVGYYNGKRATINRSAGSIIPMPTLQFESGLNVGQMCNITALLTNFMGIHPQDKPKRNWHR